MKNLFVGNISFQTTEADWTTLFRPFGQVRHIGFSASALGLARSR